MGKFNAGYADLDIFEVQIIEMNPKSTDHFYRHAINALQKIKIGTILVKITVRTYTLKQIQKHKNIAKGDVRFAAFPSHCFVHKV